MRDEVLAMWLLACAFLGVVTVIVWLITEVARWLS